MSRESQARMAGWREHRTDPTAVSPTGTSETRYLEPENHLRHTTQYRNGWHVNIRLCAIFARTTPRG